MIISRTNILQCSLLFHSLKNQFLYGFIMPRNTRPSSDYSKFREIYSKAKYIVALTGAGISAESGVPTFRGEGGLWRKYRSQELATLNSFVNNPSLVWEFYSYRRELVLSKRPNSAHFALAEAEKKLKQQGRKLVIITQNIDELHRRAGSENIIELHGTLFKTSCIRCGDISVNYDSPICEALKGKDNSDPEFTDSEIPIDKLPHCRKSECKGLLRPYVVWFGEALDDKIITQVHNELESCDLCLVIGTSSVVYPAAMFAPQVANRGVPVAEFNIESTSSTNLFGFHFEGACGTTLPKALKV